MIAYFSKNLPAGFILFGKMDRKQQAEKILYEYGLFDELCKYGKPHVIGSCRIGCMAWNDLDVNIENSAMSKEKLYELSEFILRTFSPTWYEAKEEVTDEGKTVWFHGFEAVIDGEKWNFDLWFFDGETIAKAEQFCDSVAARLKATPGAMEAVVRLKQELIARGMYTFEQYSSMNVYDAVLRCGIRTIDEFLENYRKPADSQDILNGLL